MPSWLRRARPLHVHDWTEWAAGDTWEAGYDNENIAHPTHVRTWRCRCGSEQAVSLPVNDGTRAGAFFEQEVGL